jgi:hypothetical protein
MKKFAFALFCLFQLTVSCLFAQNHSLLFTSANSNNVVIANGPILGKTFTIEAFVQPQNCSATHMIIGNNDKFISSLMAPWIEVYTNKVATVGFTSNATSGRFVPCINNNTWNHIALTYDGAMLRVYLDGVLKDSSANTATPAAEPIKYIGGQTRPTINLKEYFNGYIDEIRVWNVTKTGAEINAGMTTNSLTGSESGLQMLYTFEGNVTDLTGKTTATLNGATYASSQFQKYNPTPITWIGNGTNGTLSTTFTTSATATATGATKYAPKNILAAWITTQSGTLVKTLKFNAGQRQEDFQTWNTTAGNYAPDVISGASLTAFGTYTVNWDGIDMYGNLVDDGNYILNLELNDNQTPIVGSTTAINFVKGASSQTLNPADVTSFSNTTVTWTPATTVTPSVVISTPNINTCWGTSVTFTATPTNGGTTPLYQWKKNGNNVGANSTTNTYSSNVFAFGDVISCVITSNAANASPTTATSNSVTMNVSGIISPSINISTPSNTICSGTNITFTSVPTNGGTPTYQWKKNGNNVATTSTYADNALANNDIITCIMTSTASCVSSATATSNAITMTVNTTVTPSVTIGATQTSVCSGANVTFTATPSNGGTTPTYQWKKNGTNVGSNSAVNTYSDNALANNDAISCVITSNAVCATSATATSNSISITTNSVTPSITIATANTTICEGTNVTFTSTPTNGGTSPSYQWKKNGINVGTGTTYSDNAFANNDVISCYMTSNASCTTSSLALSNNITMTVNPIVTPTIQINTANTTICAGTNTTFTATPTNGGTPSYQWQKNGNTVGTSSTYSDNALADQDVISCIVTSTATCPSSVTANSNSITMSVGTIVTTSVTISTPKTTIPSGTSVIFTATPTNGGSTPTFQWKKNGNDIGTGITYTDNAIVDNDIISCIMISNASCVTSATATSNSITMHITPIQITTDIANVGATIGSNITLTVDATPATVVYQWQVDMGSGFADIVASSSYSGQHRNAFTINAVPANFNAYKYRCVITYNAFSDTSKVATLDIYPTNIEEPNQNAPTFIYPTVADEVISIITREMHAEQPYTIVNSKGEIITSSKLWGDQTIIDVSKYTPGIFFIIFTNSNVKKLQFVKE